MHAASLSFFLQSNPPSPIVIGISITAILVSAAAFVFSIISFKKTRTATLYSDIDGRYLELFKLAIANPGFVDPALTENYKEHFEGNELLKYERYAFAAWNIVETIVDRRENDLLAVTWDPVIVEENKLHRWWLNDKDNEHKFKKSFWRFILNRCREFPCPDCVKLTTQCNRCKELHAMVNTPS